LIGVGLRGWSVLLLTEEALDLLLDEHRQHAVRRTGSVIL
jgi:hypothetical protein